MVEPIVAKAVLPTFGGAPMVWNTCVVFFQLVLLAGYGYAHAAGRWLESRRHAIVYAILLALPLLALPFATHIDALPPGKGPTGWLLLQLLGLIGLPFFALSTSAAVLQRWFSTTRARAARDPYFLYAASNTGSLVALIAYPTAIEPMLRLRDQSRIWTVGYTLFIVAVYACAAVVWRRQPSTDDARFAPLEPSMPGVDRTIAISPLRRARWVALAFIPSSLMLAVTSYFSTDIAAVPLLWVVPLSLYLLTFVIAFGARSGSAGTIADRALALLVLPLAMLMITQAALPLWLLIPLHLLVFVMAGLVCHGQLAADRPPPSSLTEFYFWIALGGVLGGMFNTLVAPVLFNAVVEYPLVLVLACFFRAGMPQQPERPRDRWMDVAVPVAIGALTAGLLAAIRPAGDHRTIVAALALPAFAAFHRSRSRTTRFALALAAMLLAGSWGRDARARTLHVERTFFGVYRVSIDAAGTHRLLFHGTTLHGLQAIDPAQRREPLGYYHRTGPFGQALPHLRSVTETSEIAVVGLGVGSLASYATRGQRWTFYELDPVVERLARTEQYFTYLRDCGNRCRVVLGDARLSLADARPHQYDLLVIDAFSSDAIPMHLLTDEAVALYRSRLAAGGVLALHISNRHLALGPVLARLARAHQLVAIQQHERVETTSSDGKSESDWVLMAARSEDLGSLPGDARWTIPAVAASTPLWTDDSSSILSVLHYR